MAITNIFKPDAQKIAASLNRLKKILISEWVDTPFIKDDATHISAFMFTADEVEITATEIELQQGSISSLGGMILNTFSVYLRAPVGNSTTIQVTLRIRKDGMSGEIMSAAGVNLDPTDEGTIVSYGFFSPDDGDHTYYFTAQRPAGADTAYASQRRIDLIEHRGK
jgi:hypothetical protein